MFQICVKMDHPAISIPQFFFHSLCATRGQDLGVMIICRISIKVTKSWNTLVLAKITVKYTMICGNSVKHRL